MERSAEGRSLATRIASAFDDVEAPAEDHIVVHPCEECEQIREAFRGKHWRDINAEFIASGHGQDLFLMTPEAFRFYLAAYLISAVMAPKKVGAAIDSTVNLLTRPESGDTREMRDYIARNMSVWAAMSGSPDDMRRVGMPDFHEAAARFDERVGPLSKEQKSAIRAFLEYAVATGRPSTAFMGPRTALDRYWAAF